MSGYYIKVRTTGFSAFAVGSVMMFKRNPGTDWLPCDGRFLCRYNYPELFDLVRGAYTTEEIKLPYYKLRKLFGLKATKTVSVYAGSMFRIPDLREGVIK